MKKILLLILFSLSNVIAQTLTVSMGDADRGSENITYGYTGYVTLAQYKLSASADEDIKLDRFYFRLYSNGGNTTDDFYASDIRLYQDVDNNGQLDENIDIYLGAANYGWSGTYSAVWVNVDQNELIIPAGASRNIIGVGKFRYGAYYARDGIYYQLRFENNSFAEATGTSTDNAATISGASFNAGTKTIVSSGASGQLTISESSNNPPQRNIAPGASKETMLNLTLSVNSIENIILSQLSFDLSGSGNDGTDIDSIRLFWDNDNNGILSSGDTQTGQTITSISDNGTVTFNNLADTIDSNNSKDII